MDQPIPAPAPAPTSAAQFFSPHPVISTKYYTSHPVQLKVVRKVRTISRGNFDVKDTNGTLIFQVERKPQILPDKRVLLDAAGKPIVTLRRKKSSAHHRWNVYKGDSTEPSDLIFTVKRSAMIQLIKAKLHVFLANNNTEEKEYDYMVRGTWAEKECVVTDRTNNMVAEMSRKTTTRNALIGKDNYVVTVHPNVDHAFIVTLIVILDDMNHISDRDEMVVRTGIAAANVGMTVFGLQRLSG